jgi:arabinofuranosyltransferase
MKIIKTILFYLPLVIIVFLSYLNRHFYFDDVLIYARYVENFLNGHGLVYNIGERFNGLTSPLFTYLSIIWSYFTNNVILSMNILSGLSFLFAIYFLQKLLLEYLNSFIVFLLSILIISNKYFYFVFGMETHLFLLLVISTIWFFIKNDNKWLIISGALLILTRSEGVFLILTILIFHFVEKREFPKFHYFLIPIFMLLAHFSFNFFYYGEFLPHTGMAKMYQGMSGLWGIEKPLMFWGGKIILDMAYNNNVFFASIIISLAIFGFMLFVKSLFSYISITFLSFLFLFYSLLNVPNYHWYYAPFVLFSYVFAAIGAGLIHQKIKNNTKIYFSFQLPFFYYLYIYFL